MILGVVEIVLKIIHFLKLFKIKKRVKNCSQEEIRGKFDFDHHFAFLTIFLKIYNFFFDGIF